MGSPIKWPVFLDDKYYHAIVDVYQDMSGKTGCEQTHQSTIQCCMDGLWLNRWITHNWECVGGFELCVYTGFSAQRLMSVFGPFDTIEECWANITYPEGVKKPESCCG